MSKKAIIILTVVTLLIAGGLYWWYSTQIVPLNIPESGDSAPTTFSPINRPGNPPSRSTSTKATSTEELQVVVTPPSKPSILRHLSTAPVGGFMASSTASSTVVRYIDRGTGYVYQAMSNTNTIDKISNTTLPKIYESYWNKSLSIAILRYIKEDSGIISNFYAEIRPVKTSTSTQVSTTPYEIKGKFMSPDIDEVAVSPKGDRIFTLNIENAKGIGYVSGFDESKKTEIYESPLTGFNVDWPEENTVAITTKASGISAGFLYLVDVKKASSVKVLGNIVGLSTKVSSDAKKVIFSTAKQDRIATSIYNIKDGKSQDIIFRTLAEKCVWSRIHPDEAYCAVPSNLPPGFYPDDWYKGNVSFVDQIWHVNASTGEITLIANLLTLSNSLMDATNLTLDPKENFLYFINKRDLTLWSLDISNS